MSAMRWRLLPSRQGGKRYRSQRILDIKPGTLHQRTTFYVGSYNMVKKAESFGS